ncbi:MAG: lipid-A-disaccharide synthase [Deltaproteobacteria bacterium]|nr:lipid-A-disaccharide synthase [Deltaproteobacteria bacterium]
MSARRVMIVAGEASGDLHGGNLVRAMHRIDPSLSFYGVGGKRMQTAGVELLADAADMAVVGLTEVAFKLGMILRVMRRLKISLLEEKPDLVILIDYPDFNLPLARAARKQGIRVFYYISPQVWAWRKGRIETIRKTVDRMAVILPFEEKFYRDAGVDVTFVGHPLLDEVRKKYARPEALNRFGLREEAITVGILPGSRRSEVSRFLPEMLMACRIMMEKLSPLQFVLPLAGTLAPDFVRDILWQFPVPVNVIRDEIYDVIAISDVAMVASGTATLETALLETPMVVVYKISAASYAIGRRFIRVDHISLPNIIAGRTIVPELIQDDANAERIAAEVMELIVRKEKAREMKVSLAEIRGKLGTPGASRRTAQIACDMLYGI